MARILGIDYGLKRTGLAVTDPLQIICSALETIPTETLMDYLTRYIAQEEVERVVLGEPLHLDGNPTYLTPIVHEFAATFQGKFPNIPITFQDERFTSSDAKKIILQSGIKKQKRRDKSLLDKISAALILEDYMNSQRM